MLLLGRNGARRFILPTVSRAKLRMGLARAQRTGSILWFHPSNFYYQRDSSSPLWRHSLTMQLVRSVADASRFAPWAPMQMNENDRRRRKNHRPDGFDAIPCPDD
jgi:hypothetical protein